MALSICHQFGTQPFLDESCERKQKDFREVQKKIESCSEPIYCLSCPIVAYLLTLYRTRTPRGMGKLRYMIVVAFDNGVVIQGDC